MIMDMNKVPELRKELEFITANPDHWRQDLWWIDYAHLLGSQCGTAGCLAGNVLAHSDQYTIVSRGAANYFPVEIASGQEVDWVSAARKLLGLNNMESSLLFATANSLYRMWTLANRFSKGEIEIPASIIPDNPVNDDE